ncbi:CC/Se motif family (seleno)protein [Youngiibacter multivorans]|uniref:Uncharacterized protein n=1 Tax=Youngiibacter multivorans TaxID=937251 RepID=A0ABS4G6M2_9CLOT|nr:CC/Se motif family (seleno)protein [Youngiibacter multivorans]MBP1920171.1 hypothetical protein [Youngiibacter multivorans]
MIRLQSAETRRNDVRVSVTAEAREFILSKGGACYVNEGGIHGCCTGAAPILTAYVGAPKDLTRFTLVETDGIKVYVDRKYVGRNTVRISLDNIIMIKRLYAEAGVSEE